MQELKHESQSWNNVGHTRSHCYWPLGQLVIEIDKLKNLLLVVKLIKNLLSKTRSATEV